MFTYKIKCVCVCVKEEKKGKEKKRINIYVLFIYLFIYWIPIKYVTLNNFCIMLSSLLSLSLLAYYNIISNNVYMYINHLLLFMLCITHFYTFDFCLFDLIIFSQV